MSRALHAAGSVAASALTLTLLAIAAVIVAVLWVASRTSALSLALPEDGEF